MKVSLKNSESKFEKSNLSNKAIIGRSPSSDFPVYHEAISRQHCLIENVHDQLFITDLGSANGVFINEERIKPHERTSFHSYDQVMIGPFEFAISEEAEAIVQSNFTNSKPNLVPTDQTRTLEQKVPHLNKKLPFKKIVKSSNSSQAFVVLGVIALLTIGYFFTQSESKVADIPDPLKNELNISTPKRVAHLSNQFKSTPDYLDLFKEKNCNDELQIICQELAIMDAKEGVVKKGDDIFIFLAPYQLETQNQNLTENFDQFALKNFERILNSELMNRYFINQDFQIHLILENLKSELLGVYRFHPQKYSPKTTTRIKALELLNEVFQSGESEKFWTYQKEFIPYMEFTK